MRIGMGYDVHKVVEGRKMIIGGVEIPYEKGLLGHSDADVLLHAISDALLGAAALGDIGKHFPDTDPAYKGISSIILLERVGELLQQNMFLIENVDATIKAFRDFIEENKTKIEALSIIYNQQYKNRHLTKKMIKELYEVMCNPPHNFTVKKMWNCYYIKDSVKVHKSEVNQLIDIISIIKYELGQIDTLDSFATRVNLNFKNWIFKRNSTQGYLFTEEQTAWLRMIRDHIISSLSIEQDDFEYAPFDTLGGLGKYYKLFKNDYLNILNEMNVALVA